MARQDPWANVPVVTDPATRQAATVNGRRYATVSSAYTNETPEELAAQGYTLDPATGSYARTVGQVEVMPQGSAPWESVPEVAAPVRDRSGLGGFGAFAHSAAEQIPFLDEAAAGLLSVTNGIPYSEARSLQSGLAQDDRETRPFARNAGGVAGFGAGLVAPGGQFVRGASGINRLARGAAIGAGYGGAYGAGAGEDTYASRMQGLATGAGVGAVGGVAVEAVAPFAQRIAGIAGDAVRSAVRPAAEVGARVLRRGPEAEVVAARRLTDQLRRRGLSGQQIQEEVARYRDAGLDPSLVDVGGENVFATTRAAAAGEGPGRELAVQYRNQRAAELAPRTIERTRQLTPDDPRDALEAANDITRSRRTEASTLYGPAYEEQIVVPDVALRALRGDEGTAALQEARRIASAGQDYQTMEEIDRLLTADLDQAPVASGRALETVRRAYASLAEDATEEYGIGLRNRLSQIDAGLDEIPQLREARRAYATASNQIDALGGVPNARTGRQVISRPDRAPMSAIGERSAPRYEAYATGLPAESVAPNQIYQRDQLINQLANAREGAVGPLNAITPGANQPLTQNAPAVARNLEATFPGQGQRYQQDIDLARQQMTRADAISPNAGPKSANVLLDQTAEGAAAGVDEASRLRGQTLFGAGAQALGSVLRKAGGLTEQERAAIVQLGLGPAEDIVRIVQLADESRALGRPPPREVRSFIQNTRNVLGSNNPVTQQLQTILLPTRVSAEAEEE